MENKDFKNSTHKLPKNGEREKHITKIVITGGPCAGKTTALSRIQTAFTDLGYAVVFIPETATELITGGIAPWTLESNLDYQLCQMKLQLEKERIFAEGAEKLFGRDKVLVVCDRGAMDNKAYMTEAEFANVLRLLGRSETELRDEYDAVFHLVTAAKGAVDFTQPPTTAQEPRPQKKWRKPTTASFQCGRDIRISVLSTIPQTLRAR